MIEKPHKYEMATTLTVNDEGFLEIRQILPRDILQAHTQSCPGPRYHFPSHKTSNDPKQDEPFSEPSVENNRKYQPDIVPQHENSLNNNSESCNHKD